MRDTDASWPSWLLNRNHTPVNAIRLPYDPSVTDELQRAYQANEVIPFQLGNVRANALVTELTVDGSYRGPIELEVGYMLVQQGDGPFFTNARDEVARYREALEEVYQWSRVYDQERMAQLAHDALYPPPPPKPVHMSDFWQSQS